MKQVYLVHQVFYVLLIQPYATELIGPTVASQSMDQSGGCSETAQLIDKHGALGPNSDKPEMFAAATMCNCLKIATHSVFSTIWFGAFLLREIAMEPYNHAETGG